MQPFVSLMRLLPVLVLVLLGACGGGESGGGPGSGSNNPPTSPPDDPAPPPGQPPPPPVPGGVLSVSSNAVTVQAPVNQQDAIQSVQVSLQNLPAPVYVGGFYTTSGIHHLGILDDPPQKHSIGFALVINFDSPPTTAPGTYQDTITVLACLEWPCVNHVSGSPQTISTTYTVLPLTGPPSMTLQQTSVSWNGSLLDPTAPPPPKVDVSFSNIPSGQVPYVFLSNTSNAIAATSYYPSGFGSTAAGRVELGLKTAPTLGVGTFTDTVTVRACMDAGCATELAGSPAHISVEYTVTDVQTGPGYRTRSLAVKANDMVWDATRQVIYVAMAADSPANANTIGVLDPVSGTFQSYAPVGANPRRLQMSADGQYLYVGLRGAGEIQRLVLPSLTLDLTIPLGVTIGGQPLYSWEFHTSPDSPRTLGVVRADASNNARDLVIYDDAVMRPQGLSQTLAAERVSSFQWDTGTRIFGFHGPDSLASHIEVNAGGVQMTASQQIADATDRSVHLFNSRMYTQLGRVFNALTFAGIGTFPLDLAAGSNAVLTLDRDQQMAFFLVPGAVKVFDVNTLAFSRSIPVPNAAPDPIGARMIRWGQNGLALLNYQAPFLGASGILLIDGTFVTP